MVAEHQSITLEFENKFDVSPRSTLIKRIQHDEKLQIAGLTEGADKVVVRRDQDTIRSMSMLYLKEKKLLAVDAINRPRDFVFGKKLILYQPMLDTNQLADRNVALT